jgi:hypothetical protein
MDWTQLLFPVMLLITAILLVPHFKKFEQKKQGRLDDWAKSAGVTIINHRGARFYEGPGAWGRGEYQETLRLEVRDAKGQTRLVWLTFSDTNGALQKSNIELTDVTWG